MHFKSDSPLFVELLESRCLLSAGDLDTSFGSAGIARYDPIVFAQRGQFTAVAVLDSGKILAYGSLLQSGKSDYDIVLARFNTNGTLDTSFGNDGVVARDVLAGQDDFANGITLLAGGKFLLTGRSGYFSSNPGSGFVLRFNSSGSLDTTFGIGGRFSDNQHKINSLTVQPDGKLVAPGLSLLNGENRFGVIRLTTNGSLDSSFGSGGRVVLNLGRSGYAQSASVQPNGKLVVGGNVGENDEDADFCVVRLQINGALDTSFGDNGKVVDNFSGRDTAPNLDVQPDGKIVGSILIDRWNNEVDAGLFRLNPNGSLDSEFGTNGKSRSHALISPPTGAGSSGPGLFRQSDGRLVIAGYLTSSDSAIVTNSNNSFVARINSDGTPDTSFGVGGFVHPSSGNSGQFYTSFTQQADGNLVAAGFEFVNNQQYFIVSRFLSSATLPDSVQGNVYVDTNVDGIRNTKESGRSDAIVFADLDTDGRLDENEPATLSDVYGNYSITNLSAGSYRIRFIEPNGFNRTQPTAGYYDLSLASGQTALGRNFGIIPKGTVTVSAADRTASESGNDTARFTITRTGSKSSALLVKYRLAGIALNGIDYAKLSGIVTIPAGSASSTITVKPKNDTIPEPTETFDLSLVSDTAYLLSLPKKVSFSLVDNDPDAGGTLDTASDLGTLTTYTRTETVGLGVGVTDFADVYRFRLAKDSNVTISLSDLKGNANLELLQDVDKDMLVDSDETLKLSANNGDDWISSGLRFGNYVIRVRTSTGAPLAKYTLKVNAYSYLDGSSGEVSRKKLTPQLVGLERADGSMAPINPALTTWLVMHGRLSGPHEEGIERLAEQLDISPAAEQVLTLDWSSITSNLGIADFTEESWIPYVADWVAKELMRVGFNTYDRINLIGHSWGGVMAAETASRMKVASENEAFGVDRIVALDPAMDSSLNGFNTNGVSFSENSKFSWAFLSSVLGSARSAGTADESFRCNVGAYATAAAHSNVVDLFSSIIAANNLGTAPRPNNYFNLSNMEVSRPWRKDIYNSLGGADILLGEHEAVIEGKKVGDHWVAKKLRYIRFGTLFDEVIVP